MSRDSKRFGRESVIENGVIAGGLAMAGGQSLAHGLFVAHVTEAQATIGNRIADFGLLGAIGCVAVGGILRTVDQRRVRKQISQNKLIELKTRLPELAEGENSYAMHGRHAGLKALGDERLRQNYLPRWFDRDAHFKLRSEVDMYDWLDKLVDNMADDLSTCSMTVTAPVFDHEKPDVPFVGSVHTTMTRIENTVGLLDTLVRIAPAEASVTWAQLVADRAAYKLVEATGVANTSQGSDLIVDSFQRV